MVRRRLDRPREERHAALSCGWSEDQKFLLAEFSVRTGDDVILSGTQRIGWDPLTHRIKSWYFDSHGGYGEGDWTGSGGDWTVRSFASSARRQQDDRHQHVPSRRRQQLHLEDHRIARRG